jgi:hypothetical protein
VVGHITILPARCFIDLAQALRLAPLAVAGPFATQGCRRAACVAGFG